MGQYDEAMELLVGEDFYGAIGEEEIIAAEEIISGGNGNLAAQAARARAAGGVLVRTKVLDKMRIQPAPFAATVLTAAQTLTITIQPQRLIQILAFIIPSSLGTLFDISDIRVGQQTQYITTGRVPAQILSEVADGRRSKFKFDSASIGNTVAIDVVNLDAVNSQTFKGVFAAIAVYG